MKIHAQQVVIVAAVSILFFGHAAQAKEVSISGHSHNQVKSECGGEGDVYWQEGKTGSTYGCLKGDGSGIVCSGVTAQQKKTCSTFMKGGFQKPQLPTREGIRALDKDSGN